MTHIRLPSDSNVPLRLQHPQDKTIIVLRSLDDLSEVFASKARAAIIRPHAKSPHYPIRSDLVAAASEGAEAMGYNMPIVDVDYRFQAGFYRAWQNLRMPRMLGEFALALHEAFFESVHHNQYKGKGLFEKRNVGVRTVTSRPMWHWDEDTPRNTNHNKFVIPLIGQGTLLATATAEQALYAEKPRVWENDRGLFVKQEDVDAILRPTAIQTEPGDIVMLNPYPKSGVGGQRILHAPPCDPEIGVKSTRRLALVLDVPPILR